MNIEKLEKIILFNEKEAKMQNFNFIVDSLYQNIEVLISTYPQRLDQLHKNNPHYLSTIASFKKQEVMELSIKHNYHWPAEFIFKKGEEALAQKWNNFVEQKKEGEKKSLNTDIVHNINFIKQHANSSDKTVRHNLYKAKNIIASHIEILTQEQMEELLAIDSDAFKFVKDKRSLVKSLSQLKTMPFINFSPKEGALAHGYLRKLLAKSDMGNLKIVEQYTQSNNSQMILNAIGATSSIEAVRTILLFMPTVDFIFSKEYPEKDLKTIFENPLIAEKLMNGDIKQLVQHNSRTLPAFVFPIIADSLEASEHFILLRNNPNYGEFLQKDKNLLIKVLEARSGPLNNAQLYIENVIGNNKKELFDICFDIALQNTVDIKNVFLINKVDYIAYTFGVADNYDEYDASPLHDNSFYQNFLSLASPYMNKLNETQISHIINICLIQIEEPWAKSFLSNTNYQLIDALLKNSPEHYFSAKSKEFLNALKEKHKLHSTIDKSNFYTKIPKI